jgi:TPR repeat protein
MDDFKSVEQSAIQGNMVSQYAIGSAYRRGICTAQDNSKAVEWYTKAANLGYANAQNNLAYMYECGLGVEKDCQLAIYWYRKAADQGHAASQNNLGHAYRWGIGVEQSDADAIKWYQKSVDQNCKEAQNNLAYMYENGFGVEKNIDKALELYNLAVDQGANHSYYNMAVCLTRAEKYTDVVRLIEKLEARNADTSNIYDMFSTVDSAKLAKAYMELHKKHNALENENKHLQRVVQHLQVCPAESYKEAMAEFEIASKNGVL